VSRLREGSQCKKKAAEDCVEHVHWQFCGAGTAVRIRSQDHNSRQERSLSKKAKADY